MADPFPEVNFDWLANLPDVYQAAQIQAGRKATLANLNSADPASLDKAIAGLLAAGDTETAIKLYNARSTRITANQRMADAAIWADYLRRNPGILAGGGGKAPELPQTETPPGANYNPPVDTGPAPPTGPAFSPPPPITPGGSTTVPPGLPVPGPQTAVPSAPPTMADMLQQGQPVQLAGPVPTPDTGPVPQGAPPMPPGLLPSTIQGATIPAPPVQAAPPVPPSLSRPMPTAPAKGSEDTAALETERDAAFRNLYSLPPRPPPGALRAATARYQSALERLKYSPDVVAYQLDRSQRLRNGEPDVSYQDWKNDPKIVNERYKAVMDAFAGPGTRGGPGGYRAERMKAENLLGTVNQMDALVRNPKFVSGEWTWLIQSGMSRLSALTDFARSIGVPESYIPNLDQIRVLSGARQSAALAEAFTALSNRAIYETLGTLGNQISEGDRNFMVKAFPSLSLTKAGNIILLDIMRKIAEKSIIAGRAAEDYMRSRPETRLTVAGMDKYVRDRADKNSAFATDVDANGNPILNSAGKEMQDRIDEALRASGKPPPTQKYFGPNPKGGPDVEYLQLPDGRWVPKSSMQGT